MVVLDPFAQWYPFLCCPQIVGHMFAHPVVYDLVADSDEQKQEVLAVLESIIGWYGHQLLFSLHCYPPYFVSLFVPLFLSSNRPYKVKWILPC